MAKDKRSRDQKRRSKLAERARKQLTSGVQPYSGRKYQHPHWATFMFETELGVFEAIKLTDSRLKNDTVKIAFTELVLRLRHGLSPTLTSEDVQPALEIGNESEFIIFQIRSHWTEFFEEYHKVAVADLIGVIRTLLHSIEAHEWNTGRDRGYVAFLEGFMERHGVEIRIQSSSAYEDGAPKRFAGGARHFLAD